MPTPPADCKEAVLSVVVCVHVVGSVVPCSQTRYRIVVGFVPGFAYMAPVDPRIAAPRRAAPRVKVPRGSVAIAAGQTGIYPAETPGGWNLIGRTPIRPYAPGRSEPFLLRAGDRVRFRRITGSEYREMTEWSDV